MGGYGICNVCGYKFGVSWVNVSPDCLNCYRINKEKEKHIKKNIWLLTYMDLQNMQYSQFKIFDVFDDIEEWVNKHGGSKNIEVLYISEITPIVVSQYMDDNYLTITKLKERKNEYFKRFKRMFFRRSN